MPTLYLTEDRALVRRDSEDCLLVQIPERRGKDGSGPTPARNERIPLVKVDDVVVMGEVTLTASALHLLLDRNIEINFLSYYGKFKGRLSPPFSKNALLRLAQYRAHNPSQEREAQDILHQIRRTAQRRNQTPNIRLPCDVPALHRITGTTCRQVSDWGNRRVSAFHCQVVGGEP